MATCIGIIIVTENAQILAFFHIRWRQKDDELPPLLKYYKKRIAISFISMFIITEICAFLGVLFQLDKRLFIAIAILLAWLGVNVGLAYAMRYISLRKEIAERKRLQGEEARE
ncbi:MAG: hypothetical protein LBL45_11860 [Treponema sp.]|nr:hypothetical protein [Treponema sp.]